MPEWLVNIGWILLVVFFFGFSVFIHEFGHMLAAMWRGFHIEKFSIGFGHRIWGFRKNNIDFIIGWLPFGGYVHLPQLEPLDEPTTPDGKLLPVPKASDRIIVALAGPVFNLLFAFVLATILWKTGKPSSPPLESLTVSDIPVACIDYESGLRNGDDIKTINGMEIKNSEMFMKEYILSGNVNLTIERDDEIITLPPFTPEKNPDFENLAMPPFGLKETAKSLPAIVKVAPKKNDDGVEFAAYKAGIRRGDQIIKVDGQPINYIREVTQAIRAKKGEPLVFTIKRDGQELDLEITPVKIEKNQLGIGFARFPVVFSVPQSGSAYKSGIRRQDKIVLINGKNIKTFKDFQAVLDANKGKEVEIEVERGEERLKYTVMNKYETYQIGVQFGSYLVYKTPKEQFIAVFSETFKTLKALVTGTVDLSGLSGPVGISQGIYNQFKYGGLVAGLAFIFMINISLAVFNLLPLPVLDGGHIFIAVAELISRKKIPAKILMPVQSVFVIMFIFLMLFVTTRDIKRTGNLIKWAEHEPGVERLHKPV